jgi:hypothetical protein
MAKMCTIRREDDGGDEAPHHQLSTAGLETVFYWHVCPSESRTRHSPVASSRLMSKQPASHHFVEREGGLKARQRRAALVPCRDEFVASRLQYLDQANRLVGPSPASLASTASRSEGARSIPWARLDGSPEREPEWSATACYPVARAGLTSGAFLASALTSGSLIA